MQKMDKPLKQRVKPKEPSPVLGEPIDKFITEEEANAPIPDDQEIIFMGNNKNYNTDSNAKTITVLEDGTVIYSY